MKKKGLVLLVLFFLLFILSMSTILSINICCFRWAEDDRSSAGSNVECTRGNSRGGLVNCDCEGDCVDATRAIDCQRTVARFNVGGSCNPCGDGTCQIDEIYGENHLNCPQDCPAPCTPATCSSLGKECGSWSNGCGGSLNCGNCASGYTCNSGGRCIVSSFINNAFFSSGAGALTSISIANPIYVNAWGANLTGEKVNFKIFNSTNILINNTNITTNNETWAVLRWYPPYLGEFYFNATLISTGQTVNSSRVTITIGTRTTQACNGTLPANATWNDGTLLEGTFTQTTLNGINWLPLDKKTSFNITAGECNFKCNMEYSWNGNSCIRDTNYCWQLSTETACKNASNSVAKASLGSIIGADCGSIYKDSLGCNYSVSCLCDWNTTSCTPSRSNYTLLQACNSNPPGSSGYCDVAYRVQDNCNTNLNTLVWIREATWRGGGSAINCQSNQENFPCPNTARVPFFTLGNLIITLILLVLIYFILFALQKRNNNRKNEKSIIASKRRKKHL